VKESYRVKHGGLMRCCLQSLDDAMVAAEKPPSEGDRVTCKWCSDPDGMIFTNGAWQWARSLEWKLPSSGAHQETKP